MRSDDEVLLRQWDEASWDRLREHTQLRRVAAGTMALRAGEVDRTLYIVVSGRLEIVLPTSCEIVQWVGPGSVVGELEFFDGRPHSVDAWATSEVCLLGLGHDAFVTFAEREPSLAHAFLFNLGGIVSSRLREARREVPSESAAGVMRSETAAFSPVPRVEVNQRERAAHVEKIQRSSTFQQILMQVDELRRLP